MTMMHGHTSKDSTMQNHLINIQQQYKGIKDNLRHDRLQQQLHY